MPGSRSQNEPTATPPLRIFLSSTREDLEEYRARVAEAIAGLEQHPARMENFAAEPRRPLEVCRRAAAAADALVVCVAHCYGWVPSVKEGGDGKKSVTWYEVEAALRAGKPVFAFLVEATHPWAGPREEERLKHAGTRDESLEVWTHVQRLKEFRNYLESKVTREVFTTPDDLALKVTASLSRWLSERLSGALDGPGPSTPLGKLIKLAGESELYFQIEDLFIPPAVYPSILESLTKLHPVILIGGPGVGKSYTAIHLMYEALKEGRIVNYLPGPEELLKARDARYSRAVFREKILPPEGLLLLDDPFGGDGHEIVPHEIDDIVLDLVLTAPGRSRLIITVRNEARKRVAQRDPSYFPRLEQATADLYDLDVKSAGLAAPEKMQLYHSFIRLRGDISGYPLRRNELLTPAAKIVAEMDMTPLQIDQWSRMSLIGESENQLWSMAGSLAQDLLEAEFKLDHLSRDQRHLIVFASLLVGAKASDVIRFLRNTQREIGDDSAGAIADDQILRVYNRLFRVRNWYGDERLTLRHPVFIDRLGEYIRKHNLADNVSKWIRVFAIKGSVSIQIAAVESLFRFRQVLRDRLWTTLDSCIGSGSEEARYTVAFHLGLLYENEQPPEAVKRFLALGGDRSTIVANQCLSGIIRSWDHAPSALRNLVKGKITTASRWIVARKSHLVEILFQMAMRPRVFSELLETILHSHKEQLALHGEMILHSQYRAGELRSDDLIELTIIIGRALDQTARRRLQEELRQDPSALSSSLRQRLMSQLSRASYY